LKILGVLNVTSDSFYEGSRMMTEEEVLRRARQIVDEGGDIIDIGACSTRPDSIPVDEQTEGDRLRMALEVIRKNLPQAKLSVDTFRPSLAKMVIDDYHVEIINDVSGGCDEMFDVVASTGTAYVLTSNENNLHDMLISLSAKVQQLRDRGQKDIIIDPGFGFGKDMQQNYVLLGELEKMQVLRLPILVGVSRKSMIQKLLGISAAEALNATTVLNTIALMKGADMLRVHDVRECKEACNIVEQINNHIQI